MNYSYTNLTSMHAKIKEIVMHYWIKLTEVRATFEGLKFQNKSYTFTSELQSKFRNKGDLQISIASYCDIL